jgi:hypothetical protein
MSSRVKHKGIGYALTASPHNDRAPTHTHQSSPPVRSAGTTVSLQGRFEPARIHSQAAEWLEHLQHERGAKPSTLSDYCYVLAEPGTPHRRGKGKSPGTIMAAVGDRPAAKTTTKDVSGFLRKLDSQGPTGRPPRTTAAYDGR